MDTEILQIMVPTLALHSQQTGVCLVCGNEFYFPYRGNQYGITTKIETRKRYCSRQCENRAHYLANVEKYRKLGRDQYWKNPERSRQRHRLYMKQRNAERDALILKLGGKCCVCDVPFQRINGQSNLQLNHLYYAPDSIRVWRTGQDRWRIVREAQSYPERFSLLCARCHHIFTFLTGTKNWYRLFELVKKGEELQIAHT